MSSLADLLGFAGLLDPSNSAPNATDTPTAPQSGPWWLQSLGFPAWPQVPVDAIPSSSALSPYETIAQAAPPSSISTNGGLLGSYFAALAGAGAASGGGILQGLYPDQGPSSGQSASAVASLGLTPGDVPSGKTATGGSAPGPLPAENLPAASLGTFGSGLLNLFIPLPLEPTPQRENNALNPRPMLPASFNVLPGEATPDGDLLNSDSTRSSNRPNVSLNGPTSAGSLLAQANTGSAGPPEASANIKPSAGLTDFNASLLIDQRPRTRPTIWSTA